MMVNVRSPRDTFEFPAPADIRGQVIAVGDHVTFVMPLWKEGGTTFHGVVTRAADDGGAVGVRILTGGGRALVFLVPERALRKRAEVKGDAA